MEAVGQNFRFFLIIRSRGSNRPISEDEWEVSVGFYDAQMMVIFLVDHTP